MKYFIMLLLSLNLVLHVSCSSGDNAEDGQESEQSEEISEESADFDDESFAEDEGEGDFAAEEDEFAEFSEEGEGEETAEADFGEEDFEDEEFSEEENLDSEEIAENTEEEVIEEDPLGEEFAAAEEETDQVEVDQAGEEMVADATEDSFEDLGIVEEPAQDVAAMDTTTEDDSFGFGSEEADTPVDGAESMDMESSFEEETVVEKPSWIPVKRIKSMPFMKAGKNLNTVYIIRPGDSPEAVSEKIWGSSDTSSIYEANPHLQRSFKTGDKLYYQSMNRPEDTNSMLTFYEDVGAPSQSFFARSGQNIRVVSQDLLGDSQSWKEIWATNESIESKGILNNDVEIRYWPEGVATGQLAAMDPQPAPMPEVIAPPVPPAPPSMPDSRLAMADQNNMAAAGTVLPPPPAPPAPPSMAPPAPPAPAMNMAQNTMVDPAPRPKRKARSKIKKATANNDLMITLGGVAVALAAGLFLIMKKNKAKRMKMDISEQTQI